MRVVQDNEGVRYSVAIEHEDYWLMSNYETGELRLVLAKQFPTYKTIGLVDCGEFITSCSCGNAKLSVSHMNGLIWVRCTKCSEKYYLLNKWNIRNENTTN